MSGGPGDSGLSEELARAADFRTELRRFLRQTDVAAAEAGLTPQRYDLLLMIASAGELRLTDLCERLQLKQTAVTELVKRTEGAGLIRRRPSSTDARISLLRVSDEGERRLLRAFTELRNDRESLAARFRQLDRRFRATSA